MAVRHCRVALPDSHARAEESRAFRSFTAQETAMAAHTYKLVELVGSSSNSTDEAIRNAVQKASATIKHIDWFQVVETRGHVEGGKVAHFQVTLKVGFRIEE
jgi:flavin-binding protein dodecin